MIRLTGMKVEYAALAATVLMAVLLGGCTDDTTADPQPSSSPSSSAPPSSEDPESPTVRPATGPLLEQDHATMNAPADFKLMPKLVDFRSSAGSKGPTDDVIGLGEGPWGDDPLDLAAKLTIKSSTYDQTPRRVDDVELDGVPAYHLVGRIDPYAAGDLYGAVRDGANVTIEFALSNRLSPAERHDIIESSLASFHWK